MFENLIEIDDFLGNVKLPILSKEEIENQNRGITERNENIAQEIFLLLKPQLNKLHGEFFLSFRGIKDFCLL